MYPENDDQYDEATIESVKDEGKGWQMTRDDGWSYYVSDENSFPPRKGMLARFYGKGIGFTIRGLFLDGRKVFYRTEAEDSIYRDKELYGADAKEWLARWDGGKSVWSIEMGGLGPGYEQAIQVTAAEILRHIISVGYDSTQWDDSEKWKADCDSIRKASFDNEVINKLGLSGAQYGAASQIATKIYMDGPIKIMNNPDIKDRHIQVSKNFPAAA